MKILLLGMSGQVGWELRRALSPLGEVVALGRESPSPLRADLSWPEDLKQAVRTVAPSVIVNAAAYTAVDRAEAEPALAHAINSEAPAVLAREAAANGAWLVHFSTDYVFDGRGVSGWTEASKPAPLNVYGQTKLSGELAIRASGCRHLILRTSWIYASRGDNFAKTILKLAQERTSLSVVNDQVGAPTGAELLADLSALLLRDVVRAPTLGGTYHAVAQGQTSWHGYAKQVIEFARAAGAPIKLEPDGIVAVPGSAMPTVARRPKNSRLDTTKLRRAFDVHLPPWQEGVERMIREVIQLK